MRIARPCPGQVMRFCIAGAIAAIPHLGTFYAFTHWLGVDYMISAVIAFFVATGVKFTLQKFYAFQSMEVQRIRHELPRHFVLTVSLLALNVGSMYVMVEWLLMRPLVAQVFLAGALIVPSFLISRHIFTRT